MALNFPSFNDPKVSLREFSKELSIEKTLDFSKDNYLNLVIYETLRMEPVVPFSTSFCMTETVDIGGVKILAQDMLLANIIKLHHLEDQWGSDHDQFKPERF